MPPLRTWTLPGAPAGPIIAAIEGMPRTLIRSRTPGEAKVRRHTTKAEIPVGASLVDAQNDDRAGETTRGRNYAGLGFPIPPREVRACPCPDTALRAIRSRHGPATPTTIVLATVSGSRKTTM